MTRILVVYPNNGFLRPLAERFPEVAFAFHEDIDAALADAAGAAALISLGRIVTRAHADRFTAVPGMRWIQLCSAGADRLEGMAAPPHLVVTRAGGLVDGFVADQAMALLLALCRRIPDAVRAQAEGRWPTAHGRFESLEGRRATVLGFGAIGRAIARRLLGFGAEVTGVSRDPAPMPGVATRPVTGLHALLPATEILVMALPGGAATARMIGAAELAGLPPGALLVNIGRGGSLDHEALAEALQAGRLGGAGLDVTAPEPLPEGHPLWSCPHLLISPHVGGRDARQPRMLLALLDANIRRFLAGEALPYRVA